MTSRRERSSVVFVAMGANFAIALAKFAAAAVTGSSAMFSEGIHSIVDTGNELLLLLGLKRSAQPPDEAHPFGYGKALYFWSLIVAIVIFGLGGGASIYEGVHRLTRRTPIEHVTWSFVVLGVGAAFEGASWFLAHRALRRRRPTGNLLAAIRASKDPSIFTVVVEDSAALAGIAIAFIGVLLGWRLGMPAFDGIASILIGVILATVATLLAWESGGLLVGESADPADIKAIREIMASDPDVEGIARTLTMQLGPDDVLLNVDVHFRDDLTSGEVASAVDRLEREIRDRCPTIRHIFIEAEAITKKARTAYARTPREASLNPGSAHGGVVMAATSTSFRIPQRMKAAVLDRFGQPEEIHVAEIPVPELGEGEVLIRVAAAGVGAWDPELAEGTFGADHARFPLVLGSDGAGTIVARGPNTRRFDVRDRVYGWGFMNPKGGFFAEYAVLPEQQVESIPGGMSMAEAGALAVDGLTALAGLDELRLAATQSLLVLGASGGVGHIAVQLAKRLGVRVFAVASGQDGLELAQQLGADAAVDGHTADVVAEAATFAPEGLDAALVLAGSHVPGPLVLVRQGGRIAYPNGVEPEPGEIPGVRVQAFDGYSGREALDRLNQMIAMAPFRVEIGRAYRLDQAPQALRDVSRHHLGKLAIAVGS